MSHLLVDTKSREVIHDFASYDLAIAAYQALDSDRTLAIRSADDPQWAGKREVAWNDDRKRTAMKAAREWRRREIGATARAIITGSGRLERLYEVERLVYASCAERGLNPDTYEIESAVKSRVTLGRCRRDRWSNGCDRAFWWPKSEGKLQDTPCPFCGGKYGMSQTTLALGKGFAPLPRRSAA